MQKKCKFNNLITKSAKQINTIIVRIFEFYILNTKKPKMHLMTDFLNIPRNS